MNRALFYLWFALLKRKGLQFILSLRRPTTLIGFAALAFFVGFLFEHRRHEVFAELVRAGSLIGGALVMLGGSLFKGFLQRGLVFEPPDIEFLFTSPFTQRQIVQYRLLPGYLYSIVQAVIFVALLGPHLDHPLIAGACLTLFQIACFHLAAGAAIFAGTISETSHHRTRWMMLTVYFVLAALYLRVAWDFRLVPAFLSSPLAQWFFYPTLTLPDVATAPVFHDWALNRMRAGTFPTNQLWLPAFYLTVCLLAAAASLWLLMRLKADIFETSLATTTRAAEKRLRLQQGRIAATLEETRLRSFRLPKTALFQGAGAIVWKNLVVAGRSRRGLALAFVLTLIFSGFLISLRWILRRLMGEGGELPADQIREFDLSLISLLMVLGFFLQRSFPFDFRRDGHHLVGFRTLPISPFALALAEITVPTAFCLAFQTLGLFVLMLFGGLEWLMMLLMLLVFPAIALALNGIWNLHYLLAATKRAGGRSGSASPVELLMVVALSFLIFYPAGWTAVWIGNHFLESGGKPNMTLAAAGFLAVQYLVDFLLVVMLAKLFQRFEVSRDYQ